MIIILFFALLHSTLMMSEIIQITNEDQYNQEVLNTHKQALVQFSAEWCSICQNVKKPLEQIAKEPEFQKITFARVDIDQMNDFSKKNGVVGVPSFLYLDNGNKKHEEIGVQNMNSFRDTLRSTLRKTFKVAENASSGPAVLATTPSPEPTPVKSDVTPQEKEQLTALSQEQIIKILAKDSAQEKPMLPTATEEPGIIDQIKAFIMSIITSIKDGILAIINWIKGLFGL